MVMAQEAIATPAPSPAAGEPAPPHPARRRLGIVPILAIVVTLAGLGVRLAFLGNQSYWADEAFSVYQASGNLSQVFRIGGTEVHTPLYATMLWAWEQIGGTTTLWTHALSGLFGVAAVVATYVCLRSTPLSPIARWLAVAITAANGFGIVYAQESRPYALVLLGATGLTAVTVAQPTASAPRRWTSNASWLAWALLTATSHLLGALLVGATALLLALDAARRRRYRDIAVQAALAVVAVAPQAAWIAAGVGRGGFAAGTTWIRAPTLGDVQLLLTTTFSAGGLVPHSDGFAWESTAGVAVAVVLLVIACVLAFPRSGGEGWTTDWVMGAVLLGLAAVTLIATFLVSQAIHLWTLRNMIIVVPALAWGVAWLVVGLPQWALARRVLAVAVLVASLGSFVPLARDLAGPYKTDWRGVVLYLARERAAHPSATVSLIGGGGPQDQFVADDRSGRTDLHLEPIYDRVDIQPRSDAAIARLRRVPGAQVVVYYGGIAHPHPVEAEQEIIDRLADPGCRSVPIYGLAVISCD